MISDICDMSDVTSEKSTYGAFQSLSNITITQHLHTTYVTGKPALLQFLVEFLQTGNTTFSLTSQTIAPANLMKFIYSVEDHIFLIWNSPHMTSYHSWCESQSYGHFGTTVDNVNLNSCVVYHVKCLWCGNNTSMRSQWWNWFWKVTPSMGSANIAAYQCSH